MKVFIVLFVVCALIGLNRAENFTDYGEISPFTYIDRVVVYAQADYIGHLRRNVTFPKVS